MIAELNNTIQVTTTHSDETMPILYSSILKVSCCALQTDMDSTERDALIDVLHLLGDMLPKTGQMFLSQPLLKERSSAGVVPSASS